MSKPESSSSGAALPTHRVLLAYARPHWRSLVGGGLLGLATTATGLALPLAARYLIENLSTGRSVTGALLLMTALVMANAGIGAVGAYVLRRTAESVVLTARTGLVARLLGLRMAAVEQTEPGDLMSRVTADTTLLREVTTAAGAPRAARRFNEKCGFRETGGTSVYQLLGEIPSADVEYIFRVEARA